MDKAKLFAVALPEGSVGVPGAGTVRVRGLSRAEVLAATDLSSKVERERRMLALGMLDPELTEEEAAGWMQAATTEAIRPVVDKIAELSGLLDDAGKAAYKSVPDESGG